jgi:hypothetical protein
MAFVMRNLNSDPASRNVHLWSPAPALVPPGYHKILGAVKRNAPTATSWGQGKGYEIVEKMKGKLLDYSAGILHNNDLLVNLHPAHHEPL